MSIEESMKSAETQQIVRWLAAAERYGTEETPHRIATDLRKSGIKTTDKRVKDLLSLLTVKFPTILGYKRIGNYHLFYISAIPEAFETWFAAWFGVSFK